MSLLYKNNINVVLSDEVVEFKKNALITKNGKRINSQFNFLVTSVSAPKWLSDTKLETTEDGFYTLRDVGNRSFNSPRDYLHPISINELTINTNLIQNPGW